MAQFICGDWGPISKINAQHNVQPVTQTRCCVFLSTPTTAPRLLNHTHSMLRILRNLWIFGFFEQLWIFGQLCALDSTWAEHNWQLSPLNLQVAKILLIFLIYSTIMIREPQIAMICFHTVHTVHIAHTAHTHTHTHARTHARSLGESWWNSVALVWPPGYIYTPVYTSVCTSECTSVCTSVYTSNTREIRHQREKCWKSNGRNGHLSCISETTTIATRCCSKLQAKTKWIIDYFRGKYPHTHTHTHTKKRIYLFVRTSTTSTTTTAAATPR